MQTMLVAILALVPMLVGAQTSVTTSGFQVQNLSETTAAQITIRYYSAANGAEVASQEATIPAGGSLTFLDGGGGTVAMSVPAGFRGSVVIESDQPVVAITNLVGVQGNISVGEAYSGFNAGYSSVSLPLIMRGNFGFNTTIIVQNTGTAATSVTVRYTPGVAGTAGTQTANIQPGASATFTQATNNALGERFVGSAVVEAASGGSIVAAVVQDGNNTLASYSGFDANVTPSAVAVPLLVANNFGGTTGLQIQNNGNEATTVTVTYTPNTATTPAGTFQPCGAPQASTFQLPAGASVTTIQGAGSANEGFDTQFANCRYVGGATVTSNNNQPLTAVVNQSFGASFSAYEGFQVSSATGEVRAPLVVSNNFGGTTGIQVQNVGTSATQVTISFGPNTVSGDGTCATPQSRTISLPAGSSATRIQAGGAAADGFDDQFATCRYVGSAKIEAASGGQIVAIVNQTAALTDGLFTYNTFGQ
ncbi:hypothetical protein CJ255_06470 [Candidatus Viridilinea mediisalina]|uniref:Uncharacterized protein n=2 Tax=Candidatus Viridilinea mediisalina TaxID=2024553 RepID=A0A2A6RLF7_9CHLR|nr:hypothetical protein CJ255_06470 [Candidatus Viridilinea mediisalina]